MLAEQIHDVFLLLRVDVRGLALGRTLRALFAARRRVERRLADAHRGDETMARRGVGVIQLVAERDDAVGHRHLVLGHAVERLLHVVDPHGQRKAAAGFAVPEAARIVVADPRDGRERVLVAREPGVARIVGRTGLAAEVGALEDVRLRARAALRHALQQAVHDVGVARIDRARRVLLRDERLRLRDHHAALIGDFGDQIRIHAIAAVREHGVTARHLQRRDEAGAQRHRQIGRMTLGVEAEVRDVLLRVLRADVVEDADRHEVLRLHERRAHGHGAVEAAAIVLRLPRLAAGFGRAEEERRIVDDRGRPEPLVERRRIDERLEARTRLAPRLRDVVELVLVEVEAAHQRADRAVLRHHRDERALDLRQLRDRPFARVVARHADDRARADLLARLRARGEVVLREAQAVAGDAGRVAVHEGGLHFLRARRGDHGRHEFAVVRMLDQSVVDGLFAVVGVGGQVDESFRAAIAVTPLVIHQPLAQRAVGHVLVGGIDGRDHVQTTRVGLFVVLRVHHLTHHFRHVLRVHAEFLALALHDERLRRGVVVLLLGDVMQLQHAFEDVFLTHLRALRIDDRVIRRRRLRQPREHRAFGEREVLQILAEVHARGAREAVGALPQIDLVHVDLEDLVLRELRLDLVGEQHLVDLARVSLFARQEEVARHLHGDRARALRRMAVRQGDEARARDAREVDAAVLVEARVFDGEDGFLQIVRHVLEMDDVAPLLAEFADQHVVARVDAQRHLGPVVGERLERRQIRRGDDQRVAEHERDARGAARDQHDKTDQQLDPPGPLAPGRGGRLRRGGRSGRGRLDVLHTVTGKTVPRL
ncbi:hypothetical protein PT2222_210130 [Paraburkholderia tropica]